MSQRRSSVKGVPLEELNAGLGQLTEDFHLCYLFDEAVGGNKGAKLAELLDCGNRHWALFYLVPNGSCSTTVPGRSKCSFEDEFTGSFLTVLKFNIVIVAWLRPS